MTIFKEQMDLTQNFQQKNPTFFFWFVTMKDPLSAPMECPLAVGHSIGAKELQWLSVEPFQPGSFRPENSSGSSWGAVVGWEFPWWFKGSLGNFPRQQNAQKNQFSRTLLGIF